MRYGGLQLCGGENRMEGWMGTAHLPVGDLREASTIERSFLAGEIECVFEITNWSTRNTCHHGIKNASSKDERVARKIKEKIRII
jgi:hypothetical protein